MWNPKYQITHLILNNIRQIEEVLGEIKFLHLRNTATLAQIQYKARELSAYASTSIEGNPLSLTDVKRLLKNHPSTARILLHAFIKKTQKTPEADLSLAKKRLRSLKNAK